MSPNKTTRPGTPPTNAPGNRLPPITSVTPPSPRVHGDGPRESEGDTVSVKPAEVNDWMYVIGGIVNGGYTVNLLRQKMGNGERKPHDATTNVVKSPGADQTVVLHGGYVCIAQLIMMFHDGFTSCVRASSQIIRLAKSP